MSKPFYTARDVADETGVADSAVCAWLHAGMFPQAQKVGNKWHIPAQVYGEVCDYARERRNNRRPLRVGKEFVQGAFSHLKHGGNYRFERLRRNLRQAEQNIQARKNNE
ncbi:MAG: hypothetical protein IAE79_05765 [Anaerolinea sp.]|nr:hypothetical protein [Anaerolinea sp.]